MNIRRLIRNNAYNLRLWIWHLLHRPSPAGCHFKDRNFECGKSRGAERELCEACMNVASDMYPQGWTYYPGDTCPHGNYVGGCGPDYMCGYCEDGDDGKENLERWRKLHKENLEQQKAYDRYNRIMKMKSLLLPKRWPYPNSWLLCMTRRDSTVNPADPTQMLDWHIVACGGWLRVHINLFWDTTHVEASWSLFGRTFHWGDHFTPGYKDSGWINVAQWLEKWSDYRDNAYDEMNDYQYEYHHAMNE